MPPTHRLEAGRAHLPGLRPERRLPAAARCQRAAAAAAPAPARAAPEGQSPHKGRAPAPRPFLPHLDGPGLSAQSHGSGGPPRQPPPGDHPETPALTFPRCSALLAHSPQRGAGAARRSVPRGRGPAGGVGAAHRRLPAQPPEPPPPPPHPSMAAAPPPDNGSDAPPPASRPQPQPRPPACVCNLAAPIGRHLHVGRKLSGERLAARW
ncbi:uncharacterized protein LOC142452765 [Tenrec ecaudatus]|uniref:uncharacterized protein LOC142452765 n=1 Tax=Tenrec ecaudatus TaxID=94439 RepID=UPI003F5A5767